MSELTTGYLFPKEKLKRLIFPLIIEQTLAITVGMADTMMISSAGEAAVSGVSLVDMINVVLINIFAALATGGAVIASQYIGSRNSQKACEAAKQLLIVTIGISFLIMGLTIAFRRPLLRLFFGNIHEDVMTNALLYLFISSLSYPFLALYNSCAALFRSMGNSKISMKISLLMNVINITGNAVFIFGFQKGVAGAAIASLISRIVAAAVMLKLLCNQKNEIHISFQEKWKLDFSMMKRILRIGVPNGLENSFFQLGRVIVVSIIASFGTVQIAANAVANNLDSLGCIPGQAMSLAVITVVGQCIGAGDVKQAIYYTKRLLRITYVLMIGLNTMILIALPWILKIYNLSEETIQLATILIVVHNAAAMILWPLSFTLPNALRAANDVKFPMIVSVFSMLTFRIAFSYILGSYFHLGAIGVWIAMIMDWVFRVTCFAGRFHNGKWKTFKTI